MRKSRGQMDRTIGIQQRVTSVNGYGDAVESWTVVRDEVAAHVREITMSANLLAEMADQEQFLQKAIFTINYPRTWTLGEDYAIIYNGMRWKMTSMAEIGRRDQLVITATATDSTLFGDTAVEQTVGDTGKTLTELIADQDANTTELTVSQLVAFYESETGDPFVGPLDTLGLDDTPLAVSVRRLRGGYEGPCMRIRRISDSQHLDIGFDSNGDLDTAAIEAFCAGTLGVVQTWYDQSGARNHLTQDTLAQQPVIYDNGAVITRNGKPAVIDRRIASSISCTLANTTFGVGWRYASSGVFSLTDLTDDYVAFTTMQYSTSNDQYANLGWTFATKDGNVTSAMQYDAVIFTNGVESHAYTEDPTRQELFDVFSAGPTAIGSRAVNTAADNGFRLGYQSNFRMLDTQEFILIDNPSLTYFDEVDDAFYAALHGNQMAYFNIS